MPELERWVLHRLTELDARIRAAVRKLRLDRRLSGAAQLLRRRSVGVLFRHPQGRDLLRPPRQPAPPRRADRAGPPAPLPDHLAGAGPVLHRRGSLGRPLRRSRQRASATVSRRCRAAWRDDALGLRWREIRLRRQAVTVNLEEARRSGLIGSSLQAWVTLVFPLGELSPLSAEGWEEVLIVSKVSIADPSDPLAVPVPTPAGTPGIGMKVDAAPGSKCVRCWRVLEEVGHQPKHPALCARCADAVESGLVCRAAA